jgi:hypothetical protein
LVLGLLDLVVKYCIVEVLQEPNGWIYDGLHTLDMGQ